MILLRTRTRPTSRHRHPHAEGARWGEITAKMHGKLISKIKKEKDGPKDGRSEPFAGGGGHSFEKQKREHEK